MRVLIVEDDPLLGDALRVGLTQAGFVADWTTDGQGALVALASESFAVVVLDLGLPDLSGLDVLRRLRAKRDRVPVLVLTARDAIPDRIAGLDAGADDYLVKPVDLGELAARLRALSRRAAGHATPELVVGPLAIDPAAHTVSLRGKTVELAPREFALLHELARDAGRVVSKEQLAERLYGWGDEIESNSIEVHVHHLRRKLETGVVVTVRGVGYMLPRDLA